MSGGKELKPSLTRRSFLKTTGAVAGAAALGGVAATQLGGLAQADEPSSSDEQVFINGCMYACSKCLGEVVVRDGKAVQIRTWKKNPAGERPCAKGRAHLQTLYSEDRVKYPLRRVGERGAGEWERITWEEAIDLIATNVKEITEKYGSQAIGVMSGGNGCEGLVNGTGFGSLLNTRLINAAGWTWISFCADDALAYGMQQVLGGPYFIWAYGQADVSTKTFIRWSSNVGPSIPANWKGVVDAKARGAKLVVVDPTYTAVASKADMWIRPRPGSDPALMLACINVINEEGLQDEEYLIKNTVGPVLVRSDNHRFVRLSDITGEPRDPKVDQAEHMGGVYAAIPEAMPTEDHSDDLPVVWDAATNAPAGLGQAAEPVLHGTFEVNGVPCTTSYDLLVESVAQYTPEYTAEICEIEPDVIRELARLCADTPVIHAPGYGSQAFNNGLQVGRALATLMAVTGDLGIKGGGSPITARMYFNEEAWDNRIKRQRPVSRLALYEAQKTGKMGDRDLQLHALYIDGSGVSVGGGVDLNRVKEEFLDTLDFIFGADIAFTDSALQCDVLLPACHAYEKSDITHNGGVMLKWHEQVIEPLYECKPDGELYRLLAKALGLDEYFQLTNDELLSWALDSDWFKSAGVTLDALKEKKIMYLPGLFKPSLPSQGIYETATGKVEFYVDYPVPRINYGQEYDFDAEHLPHFYPPSEAWPGTPEMEKYPFVLMSTRVHQRYHHACFQAPWMLETDPEPTVRINPADAEKKGIEDGVYAEVFNDRGHAVAKVQYSEAVRPGTLVYPKGWMAAQHKAGHWSELTTSKFDPVACNNSYTDCAADIRVWNER